MSDTTSIEEGNIEQRSLIARYAPLDTDRICQLQLIIAAAEATVGVVIATVFISAMSDAVTTTAVDTLVLFLTPIVLFYHAYGRYDLVRQHRKITQLHEDENEW